MKEVNAAYFEALARDQAAKAAKEAAERAQWAAEAEAAGEDGKW